MSSKPDQEWNRASNQISRVLQKVKTRLMSRESEQQKEAVAWLINELTVNSTVLRDLLIQSLLKSEIIPLLCETTMTMQGRLVTSTLDCLAGLTTSEEFYRQNHASYVIASILRTGHFLTLESNLGKDHLMMLEGIAYTLEKIFERASGFRISPNEICELDQILEFFRKLLTAESQAYRIVFSASKVLSFVLRCAREPREYGELVFAVVQTTLKLMRRILEAKNPTDGKYAFRAMVMTCAVCAAGITLCVPSEDRDANQIGSAKPSGVEYRVDLADCIYSAMMQSVIPNFNRIEQDARNGQFYLWFVTCINGIYDADHCDSKDLSNYLAEQGFLQTLTRLTTLPTQGLRNETLLLLARILTTLAEVSLSTDMWLGGSKQFRKFLTNALKSLPPDPSEWLSHLSEGDARADALLVLFYYNFLGDSKSNAALYLAPIAAYVLSSASLRTKRKSVTILKALWFTFSIAAVSHEDQSSVGSYEAAVTRLFNELESADIKQRYTHHPAVVVHCLKSASVVSDKLRSEVVCLWLKNGGDVGCIVDATADGDLKNYCYLLDMVRTGSRETVDVAMKAISELLKNPEAIEGLGNIAWDMLQQILVSVHELNDYNTTSVLKLAGIFEPNQISGSLLVRLLYLLTNLISENESNLTLVSLGIRNAYCLLSLSIRRHDVRGVTMFTKQPNLVRVLKTLAFANKDPGLSHTCFNCLSTLITYQASYSVQCENTLEIEAEELLRQLYPEQCFGALKLATALLTSEIHKPLIALTGLFRGSNCDVVIREIYLQIHVVHSKGGPEVRNLCYALFVGLLSRCATTGDPRVLKSLCEMDWTYVLIRITIAGDPGMGSDFMDFASQWLFHRHFVSPMPASSGNRAFGRDRFETTLDLLGRSVVLKFKEKPDEESLRELVQSLMLFRKHFSDDVGAELDQVDGQLAKN